MRMQKKIVIYIPLYRDVSLLRQGKIRQMPGIAMPAQSDIVIYL